MFTRIVAIMTVVSAVMLGVLLFTTTPSSTGPLGILGFFVFMYITALGVLTFLFWSIGLLAAKLPSKRRRTFAVTPKGAYYYASVIALVPVMLIAIQSVGEVGVYQVLLVSFFVVIAWIYVTNRLS